MRSVSSDLCSALPIRRSRSVSRWRSYMCSVLRQSPTLLGDRSGSVRASWLILLLSVPGYAWLARDVPSWAWHIVLWTLLATAVIAVGLILYLGFILDNELEPLSRSHTALEPAGMPESPLSSSSSRSAMRGDDAEAHRRQCEMDRHGAGRSAPSPNYWLDMNCWLDV
jgi:hypothetical protein